MSVLLDGLSVLADNGPLVSGLLSILFLGQLMVWGALRAIFGERLAADEYFSLGMAGWILPVSLGSLLWLLWGPPAGALILCALIALLMAIIFRIWKETLPAPNGILWVLGLLFGGSVFLRLAFVSKTFLPLYFDSAQHYLIVKNIVADLGRSNPGTFPWPAPNYYHLGFHLLTAFIVSATHAEITETMLVLGQVILAVTPLSVFFLLKRETGSDRAGIFAVLLAAFGWYMPAHAVNWGKYPALTSLALIQFVLSLAYLSFQNRNALSRRKRYALNGILGWAILISGLVHSRSLVLFGILLLAWVVAGWRQSLPGLSRSAVLCLALIGIACEIIFIQAQDVLQPLFGPYGQAGLPVTSIVLFLSVFAQKAYPRPAFCAILAVLLFFGSLFIPIMGLIPGQEILTLLDRPFVEMILYLPLSVLGGLGLAGLEQALQQTQVKWGILRFWGARSAGILLIGLVLLNAVSRYELYPSGCCEIVGRDDLVAIDWVDKNLPAEARILVSATELSVLASGAFQGYVNGDAGAWITPLTGRVTVGLPYHSDLGQQNTLGTLCEMGIGYIYVGERGPAFDDLGIRIHPDWFKALLSMPKAAVYQVIGCN